MADEPTLSAKNPKITRLRRLSGRRRARQEDGSFVIDGPVLVAEALSAGLMVEAVFVDEAEPVLDRAGPALAAARSAGVPVHPVAAGVLAKVGSAVAPQPLLAVARRCDRSLDEVLTAAGGRLVLVLVDVADPGNAGTLVRSAEAAGAGGVVFAGDSVDPFNPKTVRATAGSLFRVPFAEVDSVPEVVERLRGAGLAVRATTGAGGVPPDELDLTAPTAILLGNEAHGLRGDVVAGPAVTIPTDGEVESLNVAMAGTLLCFEAARQRRRR